MPRRPLLGSPAAARVRDLTLLLESLEARRGEAPGLWQREALTTQLRGVYAQLGPEDTELRARADALAAWLDELDEREFAEPRRRLRERSPDDLRAMLDEVPMHLRDPWVRRLFDVQRAPQRARACEALMIDNVPTNLQTILEIAAFVGPQDVLFDIGSGSGIVVLLVATLTGRPVRGVEIDPAYVRFARERAERAGLANVEFIEADVRDADYAEGTVFYLYDPVRGPMLEAFLDRLGAVAEARPITVLAFGRCHAAVARREWLHAAEVTPTSLRVFRSEDPMLAKSPL